MQNAEGGRHKVAQRSRASSSCSRAQRGKEGIASNLVFTSHLRSSYGWSPGVLRGCRHLAPKKRNWKACQMKRGKSRVTTPALVVLCYFVWDCLGSVVRMAALGVDTVDFIWDYLVD